MSEPDQDYALRRVCSDEEWMAYHAIRRDSIYALLLPNEAYDESHPDEFRPQHRPHLLTYRGEFLGAIRIDLTGTEQTGLRLIAIRRDRQRQGHGTIMLCLAERAARQFGAREIVINAHPRALGFYLANGYVTGDWQDIGPVPAGLVRVGKRLG